MTSDYPDCYRHLGEMLRAYGIESPGVMDGFGKLHSAAIADGALSGKYKELMALAIGITVRCDGCIAYHVHDALRAGATRQEIAETVGVAIMMGGGPSVVYGCQALEALEQFEAASRLTFSPRRIEVPQGHTGRPSPPPSVHALGDEERSDVLFIDRTSGSHKPYGDGSTDAGILVEPMTQHAEAAAYWMRLMSSVHEAAERWSLPTRRFRRSGPAGRPLSRPRGQLARLQQPRAGVGD